MADDDDNFRSLVTEVLSGRGYTVVAFCDGLQAWNYLDASGADLAVLDVNMPGLTGLELLGRIRADGRFKGMPVLLLTIRALSEDQVLGYNGGADDYLPKPFRNDELAARVKVLERRILGKTAGA